VSQKGNYIIGAKKEISQTSVKRFCETFLLVKLMRIGIMCSIPMEIKHFNLIQNSAQKLGGKKFFKKENYSHDLIIVECGIGKVNAAIVATLLIKKFECNLLIFSGVAGGIDPEIGIGDVILGESLVQYDYGALENGIVKVVRAGKIPMGYFDKNTDFKIDPKIKKLIKNRLPDLRMGKILTGDTYINCINTRRYLFEKFRAQIVDMESGAVAQVSEQFGKSSVIIRCVCDLAGAKEGKILSRNLNKAAKNSFKTVEKILKVF